MNKTTLLLSAWAFFGLGVSTNRHLLRSAERHQQNLPWRRGDGAHLRLFVDRVPLFRQLKESQPVNSSFSGELIPARIQFARMAQ